MRRNSLAAFLLLVVASVPALAVPIHLNAQATWNGTHSNFDTLFPPPTTVTASIDFDVGPGDINNASLSSVSGTFSWVHSTLGSQVFMATGLGIFTQQAVGIISFGAYGVGPTISGITAGFGISLDIGTNPFTSTAELSDLILGSSIVSLDIGASHTGGSDSGSLSDNLSGSITQRSSIPEPTTLALMGIGLAGIGWKRRKAA